MSLVLMIAMLSLGQLPQPQSRDTTQRDSATRPIVVASKPFAESYILAEMFAQLLEARGFTVDRRPGLGATEMAFRALESGAIDVYPEYTGTGLLVILNEKPQSNPQQVFARVSSVFAERWGIRWLPPLGFENTYAIAVRRATADSLGLKTLSNLASVADKLRAGLTPDFIGRPDGLPGLRAVYGINPKEVRPLLPAVKYRALASGSVDFVDGYSTDGMIARLDLVVLDDDREFFPPYEAAAVTAERLTRDYPEAIEVLKELSGRISVEHMRALNARVEVSGEAVKAVATDALVELGLVTPRIEQPRVAAERKGIVAYMLGRRAEIAILTVRHLILVSVSLAAAILVALPLGLALERLKSHADGIIRLIGVIQTVPSIALLAFMIPLLGIGVIPALVALWLYSLYPIVRNTYTGVRRADPSAVNAAGALGMTPVQVLRHVRLPLAAPVIMAGIRTAAVIGVGTATLAAFVGAGGLGEPIVAGLALADTNMILSGAIPAALLALAVDSLLALAERAVSPRG
jgi:osmoprotectant transport system permease protein